MTKALIISSHERKKQNYAKIRHRIWLFDQLIF